MRNKSLTDRGRLEHILEAIINIETFVKGIGKDAFLDDPVIQSAVLYQFSVIGETVANVETTLLDRYPYPWHHVRAFRNFILHEYHAIEMWIVWDTIVSDLPGLKKTINSILKEDLH